ncbi:MAG: hypothetical protein WCZ08_03825 [Parcubacteria group bacterium]|jgi:cell division protein FtsB|nr:hypothetical protein [Candidatus Moranbacteria bacterium]
MKIKFILMPAAIVASIIIMIWHVWPAWFDKSLDNSVASLNEDIKAQEEEIAKIKNKKNNIEKLSQTLRSDISNKDLVFSYYPFIKKDEDIVNKINHIAFGSGVFVTGINVEYGKIDSKKDDSEKILAIPADKSDSAKGTDIEKAILSAGKTEKTPGFLTASIGVYGDYPQIKNFLHSLYLTEFLNNIRLFDIHRSNSGAAGDSSAGKLEAEITVSFGYLSKMEEKNPDVIINNPLFSSSSFNLGALNEKRELMSEKYPNSEMGEIGTVDLFVP